MSLFSRDDQSSDSRPILPPIRDLFGDELSRSPRFLHESAALALARLSVNDREESRSDVTFSDPFHSKRPQETSRYSDSPRSSPRSLPPLLPDPGRSEYRGRLTESPARYTPPLRNHSLHDRYKLSRSSFSSRERSERRSTAPDIYPDHHLEKRRSLDMYRSSTEPSPSPRPLPRMISTEFKSVRRRDDDDDDPTPVARQNGRAPPFGNDRPQPPPTKSLLMSVSSAFKYECTYCGKGFNRPSSLKIHINSHTGEKPFTCTVEGCGRSFSVLSNMRRHARVHNVAPAGPEASSDDGSDLPPSPPHSASSFSSGASSRRRDSIASTSSSISSRRSRSPSFDLDETDAPPEKRLRH